MTSDKTKKEVGGVASESNHLLVLSISLLFLFFCFLGTILFQHDRQVGLTLDVKCL